MPGKTHGIASPDLLEEMIIRMDIHRWGLEFGPSNTINMYKFEMKENIGGIFNVALSYR